MDANQVTRIWNWTDQVEKSISEISEAENVVCGRMLPRDRDLDSLLAFQNVKRLLGLDPETTASPRPSVKQMFRLMERASKKLHVVWSLRDGRSAGGGQLHERRKEIVGICQEICIALEELLCAWLIQRRMVLIVRVASEEVQRTLNAVRSLSQASTNFDEAHARFAHAQNFILGQQSLDHLLNREVHGVGPAIKANSNISGTVTATYVHGWTGDQQSAMDPLTQGRGEGDEAKDESNQTTNVVSIESFNTMSSTLTEAGVSRSDREEQGHYDTTVYTVSKIENAKLNADASHGSKTLRTLFEEATDGTWRPSLGIDRWIRRQQQNRVESMECNRTSV